jgi:hypothetical protein
MGNPFVAIGHFFKKVFNWVIKNKDLNDFINKFFKSVVVATVQELQSQDLANDVKHGIAFKKIADVAVSNGYVLGQNSIDLLIKLAVAYLKGVIGEQ